MKKILLILSMLFVVGVTFSQSNWNNYIRRFQTAITSGVPSDAPAKYWGSWIALDTTNMFVWVYNGAAWVNATDVVIPNIVTVDTLVANDALTLGGFMTLGEYDVTAERDTLPLDFTVFNMTTAGADTLVLSSVGSISGRLIMVKDVAPDATATPTILLGDGVTIEGAGSYPIDADNEAVIIIYNADALDWRVFGSFNE